MMADNASVKIRGVLAPLICLVTFAMPFVAWSISTRNPAAYFTTMVPPGQTFYVFSKLLGLVAMVMLWFQAMAALSKDSPALRGFPYLRGRWHAAFGVATFGVVLAHLTLFVVASTRRTGHSALDLLLPQFDAGYHRAMVGMGVIAFWILVVALLGGWWRRRGAWGSRWIHRLVFLVFALSFLHGIAVGSETRFGLMKYVYAFIGLSLGTAVVSRLLAQVVRHFRRSIASASVE